MARYYIGTIPGAQWCVPEGLLPSPLCWLRGQQETGEETGYSHYQVVAGEIQLILGFSRPVRLPQVKELVGEGHWEKTRSSAADAYVWKENTRVPGTQFEIGRKPTRRNDSRDWERVWDLAKEGRITEIDADVRIRCYNTLSKISTDHCKPTAVCRTTKVFWGPTGTGKIPLMVGKTRRAWEEAGDGAYIKDPSTKWWCGYSGEDHVILDEFRGKISVEHLLRWTDRYPVRVEVKGGGRALAASKIWITSNLDPETWYPDLDRDTQLAIMRRLEIYHMT